MTGQQLCFSAAEILEATRGRLLQGGEDWECRGISTDTRTLQSGNLFVALRGDNFDGGDYLDRAGQLGAAALLVQPDQLEKLTAASRCHTPAIAVNDTEAAYGALASYWRRRFSIPVVAITGSSGKTTTREMVAAIVSMTLNTLKTEGNFNNQIGLPLTLFNLRASHHLAVVEMGTNSPGEIAKLAAIAMPDIALITNIGPAHLEGLGSIEAVAAEKCSLWEQMKGSGTAIINHDDPALTPYARHWTGRRISFGFSDGSDVTARNIENLSDRGVRFDLVAANDSVPVFLSAVGRHNIKNALAAAAVARTLGIGLAEIAAGLALFRPVPGRTEIKKLGNGACLIIDTYNANPYSVIEALKTLQELRKTGSAAAILGDMLELGEAAERWHREVGALVAEGMIDSLYLKGNLARYIAAGAREKGFPEEKIVFFEQPQEVVSRLLPRLKKGDWVLLKGSRRMKMETVAAEIARSVQMPIAAEQKGKTSST